MTHKPEIENLNVIQNTHLRRLVDAGWMILFIVAIGILIAALPGYVRYGSSAQFDLVDASPVFLKAMHSASMLTSIMTACLSIVLNDHHMIRLLKAQCLINHNPNLLCDVPSGTKDRKHAANLASTLAFLYFRMIIYEPGHLEQYFLQYGCIHRFSSPQAFKHRIPLDLTDHLVLPGLINTHHHFYQTLTRAVPAAQAANLFNWLTTLYPIWARINPDDIFISAQTALAELALSGCTTASDHLYLFPNGSKLDDEIAAAREIGVRIQASRGSMSLGQSQGGLPPDSVVDSEESILKDSQRLIQQYHDPNPGAFVQIVLAPCSPFSVTSDLMKQSAVLAREYGVHMHTHLAETEDEEQFCLQRFGHRPVGYMQEVDWVGNDVWFAHAVWVNNEEIQVFARHNCGVAHCTTSNMGLA